MSLNLLLRCHDLEATRRFYQEALGFQAQATATGTLTVEHDGNSLIFTTEDLWGKPPGFSGTIYFTLADVDGYFAGIKDRVVIAWPVQNMPYGSREFGIEDCNGYYLAFQQAATSKRR
ncbi:VOC family protein [Chitiniphilus eburneus]|uniref:Bleomycin resistance family protein n=1 Tax=Chitiniphilus eburneus TaxID=2571148 RepID=A0A4U0PCS2_9NEIS|nr:VOC family protein [Chitiniphilus eburneus]TJZ65380.1 bleomycin resistance family protein [Chitiniphilus eburneus]